MHWIWRVLMFVLLFTSAFVYFSSVRFIEQLVCILTGLVITVYAGYDVFIHHIDKKNEEITRKKS